MTINISVVITTFNRPDYLQASLRSVLNQLLKPYEIIVVDDGSDCDYSAVLQSLACANIYYHKLAEKCGANAARNYGVKQAKGDVIAFLDDDDAWFDYYLDRHAQCYAKNSAIAGVLCGFSIMGGAELKINQHSAVTEALLRQGNNFCGMSGVSMKRQVLLDYPFDESLDNGQDWDLFVRVVCAKNTLVNISQALYEYRKNTPNSISTVTKQLPIAESDARLASAIKHQKWLGEYYFKVRVADQLLTFIVHKPDPLQWLMKSIKLAGFRITLFTLLNKLRR